MVGAHPAVPVVEVEAVVPLEALVVLDVVRRGVQELAEPGIHEPLGVELVAGVAGDVEGDLPEHEDAERSGVDRHGQGDEREDARLDDGFARAEAIRRPRAGVMALMVHAMEEAEQLRVMDEPVRPVEVRVMHEDDHDDAAPEPAPAVVVDLGVDLRPAEFLEREGAAADQAIDDDRQARPHRLAPHVRAGGHLLDDLAVMQPAAEEHVAEQPRDPGEGDIVCQVVQRDERHRLPEARDLFREGQGEHGLRT